MIHTSSERFASIFQNDNSESVEEKLVKKNPQKYGKTPLEETANPVPLIKLTFIQA